MLYKIGKKLFEILRNILHFTQIVLILLCFFIVLYWILQIAGVQWIQPAAPFFEAIKNFTHIFYNRTSDITGVAIDFAFLISVIIILLIVWGLKPLIEQLEELEEKYDSAYKIIKKKVEDKFNADLEHHYIKTETQNNKYLILVKFNITDMTVDSFYTHEISKLTEQKTSEVMSDFTKSINKDLQCQNKILKDNILLYFNDIEKVEEVINKLKLILKELKTKYIQQNCKIQVFVAVETYAKANEIVPKVQKLIYMNKLELSDRIICLSSFKQRYSLLKEKNFTIEIEGAYKLGENEEEVSVIKT